jgi:hypothetical protein
MTLLAQLVDDLRPDAPAASDDYDFHLVSLSVFALHIQGDRQLRPDGVVVRDTETAHRPVEQHKA